MRYLRYRWDEDRGDEHAGWGGSWWYFEVGSDGYPTRQVEIYDGGVRLRYGPGRHEDKFGGLSCVHQSEVEEPSQQELSAADFEAVWGSGPWYNE
jgi:hypothetical protein